MNKTINFDMDGTLANLYGIADWLERLRNEDESPYLNAKPMLNMSILARILNKLQRNGYEINIISWTSKVSTDNYHERVKQAKLKWLKQHLKSVKFNNIFIVRYDTPKHNISNGILFDDNKEIRNAWGNGAYDVDNIIGVLKSLA